MAKTAAAPAETADAAKGGTKRLVMIVVPVLLLVVAAWYFVLGPGSGGSSAEEKPKEVDEREHWPRSTHAGHPLECVRRGGKPGTAPS